MLLSEKPAYQFSTRFLSLCLPERECLIGSSIFTLTCPLSPGRAAQQVGQAQASVQEAWWTHKLTWLLWVRPPYTPQYFPLGKVAWGTLRDPQCSQLKISEMSSLESVQKSSNLCNCSLPLWATGCCHSDPFLIGPLAKVKCIFVGK